MGQETIYVSEFRAGLDLLKGSRGGVFAGKVRDESANHQEEGFYDQMYDNLMVTKKTTRKGDTPDSDIQYDRRKAVREDYELGHLEEREDKLKTLNDPRNSIVQSFHKAYLRNDDMQVITGALGSAWTGKKGTTEVTFPSSQVIDITLGHASAVTNAGLSEQKLIVGQEMFGLMELDPNDGDNVPYLTITRKQITDMLKNEHFINQDYAGFNALQSGKVAEFGWMGYKWILSELVPYIGADGKPVFEWDKANIDGTLNSKGRYIRPIDKDGLDIRANFAWVKDGILFERNPNKIVKMAERTDKKFAMQIFMSEEIGATRMEEEKVVMFPCDQSPV